MEEKETATRKEEETEEQQRTEGGSSRETLVSPTDRQTEGGREGAIERRARRDTRGGVGALNAREE